MAEQATPFAILVAHAQFERGEDFLPGDYFVIDGVQGHAVVRMSATAKLHFLRVGNLVTQNVTDAGANESVGAGGIDDQDEVGEIVDEAAGELLLLVEAALHGAALGNVHERTLIT